MSDDGNLTRSKIQFSSAYISRKNYTCIWHCNLSDLAELLGLVIGKIQ